ncbi:MAG TPA: DUF998 domain-containing protein [Micromonosporaceae bacterium]|nr:DUF998 domain-containing protein [Micromonosporaceae bacterium]
MSAAGAAVAALFSGVGLAVATGSTGPAAYVSEAGVPGAGYAGLYRASVLAIAVALALLAFALSPRPGFTPSRWRGLAVGTRLGSEAAGFAAIFSLVSAAAPCSPGCPLPPHETPTPTDLVHAGASVVGLALTALVMLALAVGADDPLARRISAVGAAVAVPLLAAAGLSILLVGRGLVTGLLERVALVACVGWLVATALRRSAVAWVPAPPRE